MSARRRCVIYTRTSTEEGLGQDFNSLDAQAEACAAYIKSQVGEGWTLSGKAYEDGGYSGGSMERPAFKRLLADIEARTLRRVQYTRGETLFAQGDSGETAYVLVDGTLSIRDLNRARDWNLPDDAANTVAGLVLHEAQVIPEVGQVFTFHGFRFEIVGREHNRITRIKIGPAKPAP